MYIYTYERVSLRLLQGLRSAVVDNIRRRIVGVMFPPSIFEDRCVDDRCVDFQRSICRPSKIDVTMCDVGDRYVDLRRSVIDVSTFED